METIAVYFEPVARAYGLQTITGLVMVRAPLELAGFPPIPDPGPSSTAAPGRFAFVMLQGEPAEAAVLHVVAAPEDISAVLASIRSGPAGEGWEAQPDCKPVEMVVFQGPHFYERYGIASTVLETLREKAIEVVAAGFSGSMAYLVFPAGKSESARAALMECLRLP
jgi:hypothetical protein